MMKLISGEQIKFALKDVAPNRVAVAFVGSDWKSYLPPKCLQEIVLSPTIGSNPYAIAEIASCVSWDNVHFLNSLHSKIYLGTNSAAVGSFNLTMNGLSGIGLDEAGFLVDDTLLRSELNELFEEYKRRAQTQYSDTNQKIERLAELHTLWNRGIRSNVIKCATRPSELEEFISISTSDFYITCYWGNEDLRFTEQVRSPQSVLDALSFLPGDKIEPDRWILYWKSLESGEPDDSVDPAWLHIDEVIIGGADDAPYTKLAVELTDRSRLSPPFELTRPVARAFFSTLRAPRFSMFLPKSNTVSITPTLPHVAEFIRAWKAELLQQKNRKIYTPTSSLRTEFDAKMRDSMAIARSQAGISPKIESALRQSHAVELAIRLVISGAGLDSGLKTLAKKKRLELSFERTMLEPKFQPLFTPQQLEAARFNLRVVSENL